MLREQGQPAGDAVVGVAGDVEFAQVLVGEVEVGAHVDDVDAVDGVVVLELLDRAGDEAPSHDGLTETGLVGHQEAVGGVGAVEPADDVLDGVALEPRQPAEDGRRTVWLWLAHARSFRALRRW